MSLPAGGCVDVGLLGPKDVHEDQKKRARWHGVDGGYPHPWEAWDRAPNLDIDKYETLGLTIIKKLTSLGLPRRDARRVSILV